MVTEKLRSIKTSVNLKNFSEIKHLRPQSISIIEPFEVGVITPSPRLERISLDLGATCEPACRPRYISDSPGSGMFRGEFETGLTALRIRPPIFPQQYAIADVLNAVTERGLPLYSTVSVLLPRRASKTTSIFGVAIGRCFEREDYKVAFTMATTGAKARARFLADIVTPLERAYPDEANRPFKVRKSQGSESITWDNGSTFVVLTPTGESFRGDAFDLVILDESGEATVELTEDLLAGILPTFDTRPHGQLVIAGTAAKFRTGNLLWDALVKGRDGLAATGIVEYSADQSLTVADIDTWERTAPLVAAVHPGIGTLTTLEKVKINYETLTREGFLREYLSVFDDVGSTGGVIDAKAWAESALDIDAPEPPANFTLAAAVHADGLCASIAAAWRVDGVAHVVLLDNRPGSDWLAAELLRLARKYRVAVAYDDRSGGASVVFESLKRAKPLPKLAPQNWAKVSGAAVKLVNEVREGTVRHYDQDGLNSAVQYAERRHSPDALRWSFGRGKNFDADITGVEAVALALNAFDATPVRRKVKSTFAS